MFGFRPVESIKNPKMHCIYVQSFFLANSTHAYENKVKNLIFSLES